MGLFFTIFERWVSHSRPPNVGRPKAMCHRIPNLHFCELLWCQTFTSNFSAVKLQWVWRRKATKNQQPLSTTLHDCWSGEKLNDTNNTTRRFDAADSTHNRAGTIACLQLGFFAFAADMDHTIGNQTSNCSSFVRWGCELAAISIIRLVSRTGLIERKLNVIPMVFVTTGKRAMYPLGWKRMTNSTTYTEHYKLNSSQLQMWHENMLKNDNKKPKINRTRNGRGASFLGTSSIFAFFYMLRAQLPTTADFQLLLLKSFHPHHTDDQTNDQRSDL